MQNSSFLWCVDGELSFMTSGTRRCSFEASERARILLTRLVFRSTNYLSLHFLFYILFNVNSCFNESTGRIVFEVLMFDNASKRATLTIHSSRAKVSTARSKEKKSCRCCCCCCCCRWARQQAPSASRVHVDTDWLQTIHPWDLRVKERHPIFHNQATEGTTTRRNEQRHTKQASKRGI